MSRHLFETTVDGKRLQVAAGFDRPLQELFLNVMDLSAERPDSEDDDLILYSSLYDEPPETVDDIVHIVSAMGIVLPESMIREIAADQAGNVGNRIVDHTPAPEAP